MAEQIRLRKALNDYAKRLDQKLSAELIKQGHRASSALFNSVAVQVKEDFNGFTLEESHLFYGRFMDTGVKASRVKINRIMIDKLSTWVKLKGFTRKNNQTWKSLAFAVANSMKKKGINPKPSKQKWLTNTIKKEESYILKIITEAAAEDVDIILTNMIRETEKQLQ